jgi:hypothetical protein
MKYKKEVMEHIKNTKEYNKDIEFVVFFLLAITFGIFGNLVANGLWEFFPKARVGLFVIGIAVLGLLAFEIKLICNRLAKNLYNDKVITFSFDDAKEVKKKPKITKKNVKKKKVKKK